MVEELIINGIKIPLKQSLNPNLNFNINDISKPDSRKTDYSKTITLPGSKELNKIFEHIFEINIGLQLFNPKVKTPVKYLVNSEMQVNGFLQLKSIKVLDKNDITYEVVIQGSFGNFFNELADKRLTDTGMNWSTLNHDYTWENICASWAGLDGGGNFKIYIQVNAAQSTSILFNYTNIESLPATVTVAPGNFVYVYGEFNSASADSSTPVDDPTYVDIVYTVMQGDPYVYPMIDYGTHQALQDWEVRDFFPAVFVKEYIDKIFNDTSFTYNSSFFNSNYFKKLIIPYSSKQFRLTSDAIDLRTFEVTDPKFVTGNDNIIITGCENHGFNNSQKYLVRFETENDPNLLYDANTGFYTANQTGYYNMYVEVDLTASWQNITKGGGGVPDYNYLIHECVRARLSMHHYESDGVTGASNSTIGGIVQTSIIGVDHIFIAANKYWPTGGIAPNTGYYECDGSTAQPPYDPTRISTTGGVEYHKQNPDVDSYEYVTNGTFHAYTTIGENYTSSSYNNNDPYNYCYAYFVNDVADTYKKWGATPRKLAIRVENHYIEAGQKLNIQVAADKGQDWRFLPGNMGNWFSLSFAGSQPIGAKSSYYALGTNSGTGYTGCYQPAYQNSDNFSTSDMVFGLARINLRSGKFKNTVTNGIYAENNTIQMADAIPPKIKQKDFFMSIIKMFNLYVEPDSDVDNQLNIETRDSFYNNTIVDWSEKLDISKDLISKPMGALDYRNYEYTYKEDKDFYNEKYQDDWQKTYGNREFDSGNAFLSNEEKTEIVFSPTPSHGQTQGLEDKVIPAIKDWDDDGSKPIDSNIRILIYGGLKDTDYPYVFWKNALTSNQTTFYKYKYPYSGHFNDPYNPTEDLNFGITNELFYDNTFQTITLTNSNLFEKYHRKMVEEITDKNSRIVTGNFYLSPSDIRNLSFRKQYRFYNAYFRLNKVIDYNPGHPITKCEFLKLNEASVFSGLTYTINGGTDVLYIILNNETEAPLLKGAAGKVDSNTIGNPMSNVVKGRFNIVDHKVTNSEIIGDGNRVMGESKGVTIKGNNNVVTAAENTVVIGDNQVVTRSNIIAENGSERERGGDSLMITQSDKVATKGTNNYICDTSTNDITITLDYDGQAYNVGDYFTIKNAPEIYRAKISIFFQPTALNYIQLSDQTNFTGEFSISVWVKVNTTLSSIVLFNNATGTNYVLIRAANQIDIVLDSFYTQNILTTSMVAGTWNHLLISRDSSNDLWFYLNGADVSPATKSNSNDTLSLNRIGFSDNTSVRTYYSGYMSDVGFYRSDVKANISELYNGGQIPDLGVQTVPGLLPWSWLKLGDGDIYPTASNSGQGVPSPNITGTYVNFASQSVAFNSDIPASVNYKTKIITTGYLTLDNQAIDEIETDNDFRTYQYDGFNYKRIN